MGSAFDHETTGEEVAAGHDLTGRRIVITGASLGLGAETARIFARIGAELALAVRDVAAGDKVADSIEEETGRRPEIVPLDLGDLDSVREAAARLGDRPIHVLVNNAGVMASPYGRTTSGFETQIGINHFGHFLLTHLLMPALLAGAPSRVIQLSSSGHIWSDVDLDDLNYERHPYDPWLAYGQSKTANVLFAVELTRRFESQGVVANAVMPGRIQGTGLARHANAETLQTLPAMSIPAPGEAMPANNLPKALAQGVATTIWAALAPELEGKGGFYLEDCRIAASWTPDNPRRGVKDYALDPDRAARLWEISERALML